MTDIVERLRAVDGNRPDSLGICTMWHRNPDGPEAADEIERLREALKKIASYPHGGVTVKGECSGDRSDMILTARAALKGKS